MLSVTIRPRQDNFRPEWREHVSSLFEKKRFKYVIGIEKSNHLQIAVQTTKRTNHFREMLVKHMDYHPEDDEEARHWLLIKVHKEPQYLVGYCTKETEYITNFSPEYIQDCRDIYEGRIQTKDKIKQTNNWVCSGINSLLHCAYEYSVTHKMSHESLRVIVVMMLADGLLPFSLARKISKKDEDFWIAYRRTRGGVQRGTIVDEVRRFNLENN